MKRNNYTLDNIKLDGHVTIVTLAQTPSWCEIRSLVYVKERLPKSGQHVVYFLFDHAGLLFYIGQTGSLSKRLSFQFRDKPYHSIGWMLVDSEQEALSLESQMIKQYLPHLNKVHASKRNKRNIQAAYVIELLKRLTPDITYNKIAKLLNDHGFHTSKDNPFSAAQVENLYNRFNQTP